MSIALHIKTTILPGNRIEVESPDLPLGRSASVFIVVDDEPVGTKRRLSEVVSGVAPTPSFKTAEDVDAYLRAERDAWDK